MLTLYYAPGSSSMAAHIALHEVGVPFETKLISLARKEQRSADYLAINPEGKVPLLMVEGQPLTEVAGILFYLARRYPAAKLLPEDIEQQARAVSWMSFIASSLHPARSKGLDHAMGLYRIVDRKLAGRDWLLDDYSVADIHLFRLFWRLIGSLPVPPGELPALEAHHDRMMLRPAVQKTLEAEKAAGYEFPVTPLA
jgi:glutathione S-transferase